MRKDERYKKVGSSVLMKEDDDIDMNQTRK